MNYKGKIVTLEWTSLDGNRLNEMIKVAHQQCDKSKLAGCNEKNTASLLCYAFQGIT